MHRAGLKTVGTETSKLHRKNNLKSETSKSCVGTQCDNTHKKPMDFQRDPDKKLRRHEIESKLKSELMSRNHELEANITKQFMNSHKHANKEFKPMSSFNVKESPGMSSLTPTKSISFMTHGTSLKSDINSHSKHNLKSSSNVLNSRSMTSNSVESLENPSDEFSKKSQTSLDPSSQSSVVTVPPPTTPEFNEQNFYEHTYQALIKKYASKEGGLPEIAEYLEVFIIDQNQPYKIISDYNWKKLEANINQAILKQLRIDKYFVTPEFTIKGHYRGHKIIQCDNEKSLQFLQNYIFSCKKPWNKAKLLLVHRDGIPMRPRGVITINDTRLSLDELQTLLRAHNKGIDPEDLLCKRFKSGKKKGSRLLVIEFGQTAQGYVEKNNGKIKFGFDFLKVHYFTQKEMEEERSNLLI